MLYYILLNVSVNISHSNYVTMYQCVKLIDDHEDQGDGW